jgi:hypothetical protein
MPDPFGGLAEADGAFVGTLVETDRGVGPMLDSMALVDFRFEVEATLKGDIGDAVVVKSAADGASCGIELPVGERAGFLLTQENGEWHGNLCWTLDADALLAAAEGPPEPVHGSPPHLIVMMNLGDAGVVALDRQGQIVGYGEGPQPLLVSVCPDDESFIGVGDDSIVRAWSFANLEIVGESSLDPELSPWVRNLVCTGPAGESFFAVTELSGATQASLIRYANGNAEVVSEEIESIVDTAVGLVAIGSHGAITSVETLEDLTDPIGQVRNQLAALVPSPDGRHLAISLVDWETIPPTGRVVVVDLEDRTSAEMAVGCDVYPIWIDNDQLSIWDTCTSDEPSTYTTELELIGSGPPPDRANYESSVVDETGAMFYSGESGIYVVEPGSDTEIELAHLPSYPSQILVVPETARSAWTGSDFVPDPVAEGPVVTFVEPIPIPAPGEAPLIPDSTNSPVWLMVVGAVMVGGVIWLLLRKPPEEGQA